ncbi:MAG: hypothetical protein V3S55_15435 [Nitrospiraceae bacterium]
MVDFSQLSNQDVNATSVARYTIHEIMTGDVSPTLILRPATEVNAAYFNALLKRSQKNSRVVQARAANVQLLEESRGEDKKLYPQHVIVGWENVYDADGKEIKFSKKVCEEFLAALPDWIFSNVTAFAGNPANFVDGMMDTESVAKN